MTYRISNKAANEINKFYHNVAKKYKNSYSEELMHKNIDETFNAIYGIENGLVRRNPTMSRWNGMFMATYSVNNQARWNFAYRIDGETIYVEDACHAQNMHENKQVVKLTESQLRGMIEKHLKKVLNEMREPVGKIGEFEIIDGSWGTYRCESLKDFEPFNDVRMYYSDEHTYCLMRREDNGTFFFAEIVPAPELGKNETKFEPKRPSEVPNKILRDAKNYLHNSPIFEK